MAAAGIAAGEAASSSQFSHNTANTVGRMLHELPGYCSRNQTCGILKERIRMKRVVRVAIIFATILAMLSPMPARAYTNYGTQDWNYTVYAGPNQFVFNRAAAIRVDECCGGYWWGRVALKCERNGEPTNCNLDVDNMSVYEDCEGENPNPSDAESWGPRDFTTVQGTWYHPFDGTARPIGLNGWCWYRVKAEARVRFLDINILTPWLDVCSDWVQPISNARISRTCDVV